MSPSAEGFSAKVVGLDGDTVVFLTGELDMATAPELTGVLGPLIEHGPQEVVLDFSGLSFIDSSGIAALVDTQRRLSEQGRHLAVHRARAGAVRVFEIAGLVDFLHVQTDPRRGPGSSSRAPTDATPRCATLTSAAASRSRVAARWRGFNSEVAAPSPSDRSCQNNSNLASGPARCALVARRRHLAPGHRAGRCRVSL